MNDLFAEAERYLTIDWTKEPESERERKFRAAFLRRQIAELTVNPFTAALNLREQIGYRSGRIEAFTEDFQATWKAVEQACDSWRHAKRLNEIAEIIREADCDET